ncbi:glucosidase [Luteolibacter sp. LG18]|uniref:MGH1-like glycoside hydrolase domain-containing protein n=1 Tax=Luteolibacter sp. LG18 TaxID=2819286 RepID=UPI002B2E9409|nr:glucosidase [Luteolibacter sp. LG18]
MPSEQTRLDADRERLHNWKRWGPYLSERQWATVREDYSADGEAWNSFPHDHARSRAYRWGEDGLLGFADRECRMCFALALWNGRDPILKERLFGLTGLEGNHGEDVKECYYYLDSTPTHSYAKALYKYPHAPFPYSELIQENGRRRDELVRREYELTETGVFDSNRYHDVFVEYAKGGPDDLCIRITLANRGPEPATLHLLPTLWFRNVWSWGWQEPPPKPGLWLESPGVVRATHAELGDYRFTFDTGAPVLFTENDTNHQRLWGQPNDSPYVKDAFHRHVIDGDPGAVNPANTGTKCAPHFRLDLAAGETRVVHLRLTRDGEPAPEAEAVFADRLREADEFYAQAGAEARQAYAGLLWSKQYYHYVVEYWLKGDPAGPPPPAERLKGRNCGWDHVFCNEVLSMPDKWEYPWFAAWDLAFHMVPMADIDPDFAKRQLGLLLREWYMHPNGELPAYEYDFDAVNPPVHAWAAWRVYKITGQRGNRDRAFLESVFQKLLLNFTWWVNRKDEKGNNLFQGGFLGLDNIGVFDRSKPIPGGGYIDQADGTAWMAFYCITMLSIALELAQENQVYEDLASKFFEHFVHIAEAINNFDDKGLWDEQDGFYYDELNMGDHSIPLRVRSLVGLLPIIAVTVLEEAQLRKLPAFSKRMQWFIDHHPELVQQSTLCPMCGNEKERLLAIPSQERLTRTLRYMLDEAEFLSPHGIRSMSAIHRDHPFVLHQNGSTYCVDYTPAEGTTHVFGGNSNWRGPVWFPINYLLIEALERYHHFYGDDFKVEYPTGSGAMHTLQEIADDLGRRHASLFLPDANGHRPCHGGDARYAEDPHWRDLVLFYEYFHGDTGRGCGASHQTGWTALVTRFLCQGSPTPIQAPS